MFEVAKYELGRSYTQDLRNLNERLPPVSTWLVGLTLPDSSLLFSWHDGTCEFVKVANILRIVLEDFIPRERGMETVNPFVQAAAWSAFIEVLRSLLWSSQSLTHGVTCISTMSFLSLLSIPYFMGNIFRSCFRNYFRSCDMPSMFCATDQDVFPDSWKIRLLTWYLVPPPSWKGLFYPENDQYRCRNFPL